MVEYAEEVFNEAQSVDGSLATLGDHQAQLRKTKGIEEVKSREVPDFLFYLWEIFKELDDTRRYVPVTIFVDKSQTSKMLPLAITFGEIQSRCFLMNFELLPWEVNVIRELDVLRRNIYNGRGHSQSTD